LRLFLGISFLSAGIDKLTDPSYLDPSSRDYIGNQIALMAVGSPIEGFLTGVAVPHAILFGLLVMGGELLIGMAVLLGAPTRFSAVMGMLLNLTFFLSATWGVHPFYFGADLPYAVAWLTLALAGPGPFALDPLIGHWIKGESNAAPGTTTDTASNILPGSSPLTRRAFLGAGAAGLTLAGIAVTGLTWVLLHPRSQSALATAQEPGTPTPTTVPQQAVAPSPVATLSEVDAPTQQPTETAPPATTTEPSPTDTVEPIPTGTAQAEPPTEASQFTSPTDTPHPTEVPPANTPVPVPTDTPESGKQLLAAPGALPQGQALEFQLPTGQPAVLVHNEEGYSAYVAICTHEGCIVRPLAGGSVLVCPCHGAQFDPTQGGAVLRGPARRPLSSVPIVVAPDGSVYLNE